MAAEHFIPLRKSELVRRLAAAPDLSETDRCAFRQLCDLLGYRFHFDFHQRLESLKDVYAPFDADADTVIEHAAPLDRANRIDDFFARITEVLQRANYRRLSRETIAAALQESSQWSVRIHIDLDAFDRLEMYARGDKTSTRTRRSWRTRFREARYDLPIYRRLVVVFRLKSTYTADSDEESSSVYLKMFKDIPQADVEMLLPATRVKMSLLDHGRIVLPTASGVVMTLYKVSKGALTLAFAGFYGMLAFLGLLGGTIGYGVKSFFGYLRARDKYRLHLTQHLYYQNLDNNAGVLCRLVDEAEEQECREAILAYFLLWRRAGFAGWSDDELDEAAELYLQNETGIDVDFEVGDALAKLERLRLVRRLPNGNLRAVPIEDALQRLDEDWDGFFRFNEGLPAAA
jgi:hypothetical protein